MPCELKRPPRRNTPILRRIDRPDGSGRGVVPGRNPGRKFSSLGITDHDYDDSFGTTPPCVPALGDLAALPARNRNQGGIRAARANTERAAAGLAGVQNDLARRAAEAVGRYVAASQRVKDNETELLPKRCEVFRAGQQLFDNGRTSYVCVRRSGR